MKLNTLVVLASSALFGAALIPAVNAQDGNTRFDRANENAHTRPHRGDGPPRHRHRRPGGPTEILIDRLDTNADSYVDIDEFLDARLARLDKTFDRRDADGDGLLSEAEADRRRPRPNQELTLREEVIQCVRETVADWEGPHAVEDRFDNVDTNGDGYIDLAELSAALEARAYVLFERIDANGDGLISLEEVAAMQDYQINLRRVIRACIDEVADPFEATL